MRHIYVSIPIYAQLVGATPKALRAVHDMLNTNIESLSSACVTVMVGDLNKPLALNLSLRSMRDLPIRDILEYFKDTLDKHPNLEIPVFFRIGEWTYQFDLKLDVAGT